MAIAIATILDALIDNADWQETRSLVKANAFATAATRYLIAVPQSASEPQGFSQTMSVAQIMQMRTDAMNFIAGQSQATNGGPGFFVTGVQHGFR